MLLFAKTFRASMVLWRRNDVHKLDAHTFLLREMFILAWEFVTRSGLKLRNPCSNHEIHVLFEHGFNLKRPKLGPDLYA